MPYLDLASHVRLRSTSIQDDEGEEGADGISLDRSSLASESSRQSADCVSDMS